jgi:hypothetical protein
MTGPMSPRLRGPFALFLALGLAAPRPIRAEETDKAEARTHHELGLASMKNKAYGEAIAELNRAYDLSHDFAVLYDIGQAYLGMEQPVFAVRTLKSYLAEGGKRVAAARKKEVEASIAEQTRRIATVTVSASIVGAVVRVDGLEVGKTPLRAPIELAAGPHFLSASAEGYRPWDQPLDLAGAERRSVEIRLEKSESLTGAGQPDSAVVTAPVASLPPPPAPDPLAPAAGVPPTPPPAPPFPTRRVLAYALGGLGVTATAVGAVYGILAVSKRHDSDAQCPNDQCSQAGVDLNQQAKTAARVADVTLVVGLVSIGVATYLWLRPGETEANAASSRGLRLVAGLGPREAAVALRGSW